ncbi:MAG: hypothetical protein E6Q40_13950 [Cupriavidus sp.]|nr:MAG: hypothetical protein E6Q40_13950 [Cupriavidus sp.]
MQYPNNRAVSGPKPRTYPRTYPDSQYLDMRVGAQLLKHYARRDAVRHATPLVPVRFADIVRFLRALGGMKTHHA